jgi:hypothetical protein
VSEDEKIRMFKLYLVAFTRGGQPSIEEFVNITAQQAYALALGTADARHNKPEPRSMAEVLRLYGAVTES